MKKKNPISIVDTWRIVFRGGCWFSSTENVTVSKPVKRGRSWTNQALGFRICRTTKDQK